MWHKPRELTPYSGPGYEIAAAYWGGRGERIDAQKALRTLQGSVAHNAVMLNQGQWRSHPWSRAGVGIYGHYAVVWFGEENDPCGDF
jgi:hypothetical protein